MVKRDATKMGGQGVSSAFGKRCNKIQDRH